MQVNAAAPVVLKLKTPWRDGATQRAMPPREWMQRLARNGALSVGPANYG